MSGGPITRLGLGAGTAEERQELFLNGVFATVFRQVPQAVLVNIVGGVALVAAFWRSHEQSELIAWYIALLFECLLRLRSAHAFRRGGIPGGKTAAWANRWIALSAIAGALWGVAAYHFYASDSLVMQLVLAAIVLSVTFGSLTQYASYAPALLTHLPIALGPLVLRMVTNNEPTAIIGAAIILAMLVFALFFGRDFGRTVADSVKNAMENEILVQQLMVEKRIAEDARAAAEQATRSKTQFFAAASHDLRQPLQAIGIYSSLLKKRADGPLVPLVRNLASGVESLSSLVEELLEVSRLDSGAIQPRVARTDLQEVFEVLRLEFLPLAAAKRLELRVHATQLWVETDPMLLSRVLRNLLTNAIRYTPRGGVLLGARARGDNVVLEIWDSGPGIHKQELNRIFEEFYRGQSAQGDSGAGAGKGFGLGLSIVRRICNVLGMPLTVRTRPGSGTVFRVQVPRVAPVPGRARAQRRDDEAAILPLSGHTVVLLEDNEAILTSVSRLLISWGANVISATGFTGALVKRLGRDRRVDLIIADQDLGGVVNGAEAVFRIRELVGIPVPVIMLSAVGTLELLGEFQRQMNQRLAHNPRAAAAIARNRVEEPIVLTKPTRAEVLNARIATALGLKPALPGVAIAEGREERILGDLPAA